MLCKELLFRYNLFQQKFFSLGRNVTNGSRGREGLGIKKKKIMVMIVSSIFSVQAGEREKI